MKVRFFFWKIIRSVLRLSHILLIFILLGVRALLITKDNNPKWNPPRIEDVTEQRVLSFFRPLPNNEDLSM